MGFSTSACIRFGWDTFKKRGWYLVGAFCVAIIGFSILGQIVTRVGDAGGSLFSFLALLANAAIQTLLAIGLTSFVLKAHDNVESVQLADIWNPKFFWKYLGTDILYGIAALVGLVLLIVPGIVVILTYQFAQYIVIDKGLDPIDALKESARITRGSRWELLLFLLVILLLNIAGVILLFVGLLVTIPVTALAMVHAYRVLEHRASELTAA